MSGDVERVGGPARGYRWAPFEKGNEVTLKHGAWSPRKIAPLAAELIDHVLIAAEHPGAQTAWLADPSYRPALVAWSRCEARIQLLHEYLDRLTDFDPETGRPGDLDDEGATRPASELLVKLEAQALKHRERLGLDPLARSKLGRALAATAVDLSAVAASGAAALASRPPIPEPVDDDDDEKDDDDDDG